MSAYSDEVLVIEALGDSHTAFEQLVKQYEYHVLRTIASIISDEQAAQDVAQETFLAAWCDLAKLKEKHKFGGWLNQIAINLSRHWLRDQRKYYQDTASLTGVVCLLQEQRHNREKLRQRVWEAIDELGEDHREAVILHYISGYTYREISDMLSVPVSTIQGRLQKARNQLRKEFLDMVTQLQLEIDATFHKFLKENAKQNGVSVEGLVIRLIERYKRDLDNPEIAVRRVPMRDIWGFLIYGAPSPDGRYLSVTNWENFNLAVRDLTTGETRDITDEGTSGPSPHRMARHFTWSPDSKQIAYVWWNEGYNELRIVGLDGSKPRVLWNEDGELSCITPCDWSQDGKFIVAGANKVDGTSEIVLVSVADGSLRTLKSLEDHRPHFDKMSFSPDRRYIVYDRPVKENNGFRGLFLLATDGSGEEISLVGHPDSHDFSPLWAPDGKTIVYRNNRDPMNTTSLWLTRVIDGKQVGGPQFVMRGAGNIWPLGFTSEGSLYYGIHCDDRRSDIYIASLDMETGELLSQPTRLPSEGSNGSPSWSPDGKKLAYVSRRPSPKGAVYAFREVLVIRCMETGEERELFPKILSIEAYYPHRWSPDERYLLCGGHYNRGIHLIDVQTGDVTTVVDGHRIRIWGPTWSADGKTILYIRQRIEKGDWSFSIVAHDLATGQERELYPGGSSWIYLVISPDGRELAFSDEGRTALKVIPTVGGEARELFRLRNEAGKIRESIVPFMWTLDGHHLLFEKHENWPDPPYKRSRETWRIPAEGGEPERPWGKEKRISPKASFHPDGQHIALRKDSGGPEQKELWVIENLLTTFAADK